MFLSCKSVLKVVLVVMAASLPFSAAMAKTAAVRGLNDAVMTPEMSLVHKTGMRPIAGAYRPSRPAGSGMISGQHGHGFVHGYRQRHHGGSWFAGRSWFGHHSWFNGKPHRHSSRPLRPTASQTAAVPEAALPAAKFGKPSQRGEISANPRAGVTLQDKAYRALIRATYPVALKPAPRIRHVNRHQKRHLHAASRPHVRWSSKSGRRNTAMAPYIRRY